MLIVRGIMTIPVGGTRALPATLPATIESSTVVSVEVIPCWRFRGQLRRMGENESAQRIDDPFSIQLLYLMYGEKRKKRKLWRPTTASLLTGANGEDVRFGRMSCREPRYSRMDYGRRYLYCAVLWHRCTVDKPHWSGVYAVSVMEEAICIEKWHDSRHS